MTFVFLSALGLLCVVLGRWMFGQWFNHVSLYGAIWSSTLILFELRFINYYPMELDTWLIIFSGWLAFLIGSSIVVVARHAIKKQNPPPDQLEAAGNEENRIKLLQRIIWFFNIITLLGVIHTLSVVGKYFGGVMNALTMGNLLYSYRSHEGFSGTIPYLCSLSLTASLLAGNYTAHKGKLTLVGVLPIIIVVATDIANMARIDILVGAVLFTSSYFLTPRRNIAVTFDFESKMRKLAMVVAVVAIIVGGAEFIRDARKPVEGFAGSTTKLNTLSAAKFVTPSIYLYLSSHYAVLNQYFKHGGENTPFGGHTFTPVYRILEKVGFDIHMDVFQVPYKVPVSTNTGTYLRELHADFGMCGLLVGPFLLGFMASVFWFRVKDYGRYIDLAFAVFFYIIIGLSFFQMATTLGALMVYLIGSIVVSLYLDRKGLLA